MNGKSAVIVGATGGIGAAIANALEADDRFDTIVRFSRSGDTPVAVDLTSEASIREAAAWISANKISPSLIFVATGLLHDGVKVRRKASANLMPTG